MNRDYYGICADADPWGGDDFDRADVLLNGSLDPQGREYTLTGPGVSTAALTAREVYDPSGLNFYASTDYEDQIGAATIQFRFVETGISAPDHICRPIGLIIQSAAADLSNMQAHCQIVHDGFSCDTRRSGTWSFGVINGGYVCDPGIDYQMRIIPNGTGLTIIDPFGRRYQATVPANDDFVGCVRTFQIFDGGTDNTYAYEPRITGVSVGTAPANVRSLFLAAPPAEFGPWRGRAMGQRQFGPNFTATSNDWHRLYTQKAAPIGFVCVGTLEIQAEAVSGIYDSLVLRIHGTIPEMPSVEQIYRDNYGAPIAFVRVSRDNTSSVAVDIKFASAESSAVSVRCRTIGYFTPVPAPVPGATSLGTEWVFTPLPVPTPISGPAVTSGYYSLAFGGAIGGHASILEGTVRVKVGTAVASTYFEVTVGGTALGSLEAELGQCVHLVAPIADAVRVSRGGDNLVRLDVRLTDAVNTYPATIAAVFDPGSSFNPAAVIAAPTALGTASKVLPLSVSAEMAGVATYDPPSIPNGSVATATVTAAGVLPGDFVAASFSNDLQGLTLTAEAGTGQAKVHFQNGTGGTVNLASGTLMVVAKRRI